MCGNTAAIYYQVLTVLTGVEATCNAAMTLSLLQALCAL
jgi:hypothetical protein